MMQLSVGATEGNINPAQDAFSPSPRDGPWQLGHSHSIINYAFSCLNLKRICQAQ